MSALSFWHCAIVAHTPSQHARVIPLLRKNLTTVCVTILSRCSTKRETMDSASWSRDDLSSVPENTEYFNAYLTYVLAHHSFIGLERKTLVNTLRSMMTL